jgi:hypothetical protein
MRSNSTVLYSAPKNSGMTNMKHMFWLPFFSFLFIELGAHFLESPNVFERIPFWVSFLLACFGILLLLIDTPRVLREAKEYFPFFFKK